MIKQDHISIFLAKTVKEAEVEEQNESVQRTPDQTGMFIKKEERTIY